MSAHPIDRGVTGDTVWRFPLGLVLGGIAAGLLSVLPFWNGLIQMWQYWIDSPEYSHCLLIPPIAAFLVWQQKDRLERLPFTGSCGVLPSCL